jgi:hypothetical protein
MKKYVYIFYAGGNFKIGVANNIKSRVKVLQTGCPYKIKILAKLYTLDAFKMELEIHKKLHRYNTIGEWFTISIEIYNEIVSKYNFEKVVDDLEIEYINPLSERFEDFEKLEEYKDISLKYSSLKGNFDFWIEKIEREFKAKERQLEEIGYNKAIEALQNVKKYVL